MRKLSISRDARRAIDGLPPKHYKQVVERFFDLLTTPDPHDSRPLRGQERDYLRIDQGEYRIIYYCDEDSVTVVLVGKRNDDAVYRDLAKK